MKKFLNYVFVKRATLVDIAVLSIFLGLWFGGSIFASILWLIVGATFSAVMEMKYGGTKPLLTFSVDPYGNPSVHYGAGFSPTDAEVMNKYANAGVNQFKATIYKRINAIAENKTLPKAQRTAMRVFAENLQKDYPLVTIK